MILTSILTVILIYVVGLVVDERRAKKPKFVRRDVAQYFVPVGPDKKYLI